MQLEFWLVALAVSVPVAGALVLALYREGPQARDELEPEASFLFGQFREIKREASRGLLDEADAERARNEVARQLLALNPHGDDSTPTPRAPAKLTATLAVLVAALLVPGAIYVHSRLGSPETPDMPLKQRLADAELTRASRPGQDEYVAQLQLQEPDLTGVDPGYLELVERLRAAVGENSVDLRGLELLVQHESALGSFPAAAEAQERIVALKGSAATAADFARLAELLILAADGYVSHEAEASLNSALDLQPEQQVASYYVGLLHAQTGRPDKTLRIWGDLLELGAAEPSLLESIRAQIPLVARYAGVEFELPPSSSSGPSADDIAAAASLTSEERLNLARGMVQGLESRLFDSGGSAGDWARLLKSLHVLGETERASSAWEKARALFAEDEVALGIIRLEAEKAGVAE